MSHKREIDAVITWVDGADPLHRAKRLAYGGKVAATNDDVGGETRYTNVGEIYYCVGSILRFAPWVRTIHIITDNQCPEGLDEFVERNFPSATTRIEIVDHKTIFEGYEELLPTFNSISIETMMWRIPNLAEHYFYLNDDMFLMAPIEPADLFDQEGRAVLYAERFGTLAGRLLRWLKPRRRGHKPFGYKDAMINAAQLLGANHFWLFPHAPSPLLRSWHSEFFANHPQLLRQNAQHRFRDASQFSYVSLFYIKGMEEGRVVLRSPRGRALFLKPTMKKSDDYVARKIAEADASTEMLFGCVNSLGDTTPSAQESIHNWLRDRIAITL